MKKTWISLMITVTLLLSLIAPAFAAEDYCAIVTFAEGTDVETACAALEEIAGLHIRWQYREIFNGAAIEGSAGALKQAAACGSVATLSRSQTWAQPQSEQTNSYTTNSLDVMNGEDVAYRGDGMVIAVIDSGLYVMHEAFQDYGILEDPALSRAEVETFVNTGGTQGRYISQKIPFAYDYSGKDRSVHTTDKHGTHVAALALGYAENEDGSVKFTGVAPAAQLLCMKVFPDDASLGAEDADILKAMEDALLLGADVVNLSLGTEGDFTQGSETAALYQSAIAALREAGVIICCAAGNSADALYGKQEGILFPTADYTDYGEMCVPAAYPGSIAVGAVNAVKRSGEDCFLVEDTLISYSKGESETGEVLPAWDTLAGKELPYVMIGGLGAQSDFAGLDLTGCIAVVERGELYFSEKVNNAAAAGAVACIIYNNESGLIRPVVDGTTIPSAAITQAAGEYLASWAENGRGTVRVTVEGELVDSGDTLSMLAVSAWGATSGLRLAPTLSAPGGSVYSAVSGKKDAYEFLSGTSMAAPNASGAFALVLEALAKRGVSDKAERAALAESLLVSTAAQLTDEEATPLSPRRQGAGVIDLAAALDSSAVIQNPILELGDGLQETLRLSFTVKNLSENELTFSTEVCVLTDAFAAEDERYYSVLEPLEITDYMTVSGQKTVRIRAGEEQVVTLTVKAERALIETLEEVYTNGFFLEGYVTLTERSGERIHATFLGYHGDWNAAAVIEPVDFRDLMDALASGEGEEDALSETLGVNFQPNIAYLTGATAGNEQQWMLGENPWKTVSANDARIAMATADSNAHAMAGYAFTIDLYTLRHAAHVVMAVVDRDTGEIYYVDDTENLPRADFDTKTGIAVNMGLFLWDGTDAAGETLPDGTSVDVVFYAWTESDSVMQEVYAQTDSSMETPESYRWLLEEDYAERIEWSFPLTLDGTAPTVDVQVDAASRTFTVTVTENEFLAYAAGYDSLGSTLFAQSFDGEVRGESHVLTASYEQGAEYAYLVLTDYASNTVGYCIDLTAQRGEVTRCAMAIFSDVQTQAWYHEAVDFVYEEGLMDAESSLTFAPDQAAMRATVLEALYRLAGMPEGSEAPLPFDDLHGNEWYWDAVQWAYQQGIANGYSETMFAAVAPIPRQQLAVLLYRAAKCSGEVTIHDPSVLNRFCDSAAIADWAREAMIWAVGEGIIQGVGNDTLAPEQSVTRAQLAQLLKNILQESVPEK